MGSVVRAWGAAAAVAFSVLLLLYSQAALQVGYAVLNADGTPPVASALFRYVNAQGVLVWEAGVPAVEPLRRGRVFLDQREGTQTAIALANLSATELTVELEVRDEDGQFASRREERLQPGRHQALYADELFDGLDGMRGTLTFEAAEPQLAAVTLRQNVNVAGEAVFATLPVVDLDQRRDSMQLFFPHVGAGAGLATQLALISASDQTVGGRIDLYADDGTPLELELDGVANTTFPFRIEPHGSFFAEFQRSQGIGVGWATVTVTEGNQAPEGVAIFQFTSGARVISEAGVAATSPTRRARLPIDQEGTRTGVAVSNPGQAEVEVGFQLLDRRGLPLAATARRVTANGHLALFADELFDVQDGFFGILEVSSPEPVAAVTLKLTINSRGHPILTTLPVADLERLSSDGLRIFPQIGFGDFAGGLFATRLILINPDLAGESSGGVTFFRSDGSSLTLPLEGVNGSQFDFLIAVGGGSLLRPGEMIAPVAEILLDSFGSAEVVVNTGGTVLLEPIVRDGAGNRLILNQRYTVLSSEVAAVDAAGRVQGHQPGFSTLLIRAGAAVQAFTITVVDVNAGQGAFTVVGVAQDPARRIYLAASEDHTILRAEGVEAQAEVYAGISGAAGLVNQQRLQSRFRNPAFLALDQAGGLLYVSDVANHAIRVVQPGAAGRVETFAGTGQAGSADGLRLSAGFRNPQGIAFDNRGRLWVADSGNHTIRRINLTSGQVTTVAGSPGGTGLVDGTGGQARFNQPTGIALEPEPLAVQLERELRGEAPPPVTVIVADAGNGALRRVRETGEVETLTALPLSAASKPNGTRPLPRQQFSGPAGVAVDRFGNIFVSEPDAGRVRVLLSNGPTVALTQAGTFLEPQGLAVADSGRLVVTDRQGAVREVVFGAPRISRVSPSEVRNEGGESITIEGANFAPDTVVVAGGKIVRDLEILDTGTIMLVAPELPSGRLPISVQNRAGLAQAELVVRATPLAELPDGFITTVAGGTTFAGEGLIAIQASLARPTSTAIDVEGNLYVGDRENSRVRRVDPQTGVITTVAGTGETGSSGDNGLATAAALLFVEALAVDSASNIYLADDTVRVLKVDARTGIISPIAGDGRDNPGDGGSALDAELGFISGLAVDDRDNLYVADRSDHRVRRIDLRTGIITTVAGTGSAGYSGDGGPATQAALDSPTGVAVDRAGVVFIADRGNSRVRQVDGGVITTVAGNGNEDFSGDGGPAVLAALDHPRSVAVDPDGNLLIADELNFRIRLVDRGSGIIRTFAGGGFDSPGDGGLAVSADLGQVAGLSVDAAGGVLFTDSTRNRVQRVSSSSGIIRTVAGNGQRRFSGDGGPAIAATLDQPDGLTLDSAGNILIADSSNHRIRRIDAATGIIRSIAGTGRIGFSADGSPATQTSLARPSGIRVGPSGDVFFADQWSNRIRRIDRVTGIVATVAGSSPFPGFGGDGGAATAALLDDPHGVAFDPMGNLYITDTGNHRVRVVDAASGRISTLAGNGIPASSGDGGPAAAASLDSPEGIAVDGMGNVFVLERSGERVRRIDAATRIITTVAGGGRFGPQNGQLATSTCLFAPEGLIVDPPDGLLIADSAGNYVLGVDLITGLLRIVAGNGEFEFTGDSRPADEVSVGYPVDLGLDPQGNLYVLDFANGRVRAVKRPTP